MAAATRRLVLCLLGSEDPPQTTLFLSNRHPPPPLPGSSHERTRVVSRRIGRRGARVLWQQLVLPGLAARFALDVLYCPCYTVPLCYAGSRVVSVHDVIAWRRPDLCRRLNVVHLRSMMAPSLRAARRIAVPTETVRRDVLEFFDVAEQKVAVIPWGVDFEIQPMKKNRARESVERWYGIDYPYLLFVGCAEPKKNCGILHDAARKLGVRLVSCGPPGWTSRSRGLDGPGQAPPSVRHLGFVPVEHLGPLYSAAEVFVFPSLIEGFGLPAIEAMACGTPVVAGDAPALVEVCGGAAAHFPSHDQSMLESTLQAALCDTVLRERLIALGTARAAEFTWRRAVERFRETLLDAAEG